ncbi:MAG TPA: DUF2511 domain-containing protein [Solirubrobacterales bacterium]|nr:DUF2511 domain-containing protein [Solirubrobacterales bacterium]
MVCAVGVLAGCEGSGSSSRDSSSSGSISQSDLGKKWPLTVDHGTLGCDGMGVLFEAPDGTTYGLNGTAQTMGYPGIDPIWKPDPLGYGLKINIGALMDRGLELCQ